MYVINNELYHHGIKGQKWGIRRYQNEDGSYTSEGRRRYGFGERMANTGRKIRDYMTVKGDDGKELVNHFFNKKIEAENTIHDLKQQSAKYDKIYGEYKRHQEIADSIPTQGAGWWTEYSSYARNNPNKRDYAFAKSREYGIESAKANRAMNKWYREYSEPLQRAKLNKSMYSWNLDDASKTLQNNRMEVIKRQEAINYFKKHPLRSKMK